jgi:hypothetical protein
MDLDNEAGKQINQVEKKLKKSENANADYYKNKYGLEKLKTVIYSRTYRPVTVKDKPDESLLIAALRYESLEMPPTGKLPQNVIDDFVKWIWLGAPVTMKDPTAVTLRRQSGANLLMVGQRDEVAMNLMAGALVGLAAQLPPPSAQFVILDGGAPDSPQTSPLARVASALPHTCRLVPWREVPEVVAELTQEAQRRVQTQQHDAPAIILIVYGLQRYRVLRRNEDALSLSFDEKAEPRSDVQFSELLREGPSVGIHVLAWADTLSTLERIVDRQTLREFDHRVLFQMSAADSSNLIDSPVANQLGLHRAILFSEEQGGLEKFRPYDALQDDWLTYVRSKLTGAAGAPDHEQ